MQNYTEVLLIEDIPEDAELTMDSLRDGGLVNDIKLLKDGQEAVDYLFGDGPYKDAMVSLPRLILLDLKLPKVSGLEILQRLKSTDSHRHIPVVILTSSKEDVDVTEAYKLGANSYIVKPVDFDGFSRAVRQVGLYWILLNEVQN